MNWVELAYTSISEESIRKTFAHIGYSTPDSIEDATNDYDTALVAHKNSDAYIVQNDLILTPRRRK